MSLRVIKLSTLVSVKIVLSIFLTASLKVIFKSAPTETLISVSSGSKINVGGKLSAAVNDSDVALMELSKKSSTVAPIAT